MINKELFSKPAIRSFDWDLFKVNLDKMLIGISKNTRTPINSDRWEEVIYVVLKYMNFNPRWNLGSHQPGADIWIKEFSISAKSGNLSNGVLSISSYRLTRFENLKQMIAFIDNDSEKNYDIHLCCARIDNEYQRVYKVFVLENNIFKAKDLTWGEMQGVRTSGITGWRGVHQNGVVVEIRKKMSNQLWINYPLRLCNQITEIKLDARKLGSEADSLIKC